MKFSKFLLAGSTASLALASPLQGITDGVGLTRRATGSNTASDRTVWADGFDINTDYYTDVPNTDVIREYWLEVTNITAAPDGYDRIVLAVNGTVPGPTLFADWGDNMIVHVTNSLANNGSSIHFHGIRQNYTNTNDGVVSITQCPIAPGESMTYKWRATQYGTSWYHSHFGLQAWEGVFGGIVINGPATSNYDEDLGVLFLNDWSHQTVDEMYMATQLNGPQTQDNGLINGTNTGTSGGSRFETSFTSGTKYRIRLINAAVESHFKFSIDNHNLTVIASDLVPIVPYSTQVISIGMGQRYDLIVEASGNSSTNYWMRAVPASQCSENDNSDDIRGIVRYENADTSEEPDTTAYDTADDADCGDEDMSNLVPYLSKTAGDSDLLEDLAVTVGRVNNLIRWYIGGTTMQVEWDNPTVLQVYNNESDWSDQSGVIELPTADEWAYVIVETTQTVPHPLHLHGHDFFVLAQGSGTYAAAAPTLQTSNPPRRDVVMLPSGGYVVIAFQADNPGAWLMHCHIGFHTSEGFALQFVERYDEIAAFVEEDYDQFNSTCAAWTTYQDAVGLDEAEENDSGV